MNKDVLSNGILIQIIKNDHTIENKRIFGGNILLTKLVENGKDVIVPVITVTEGIYPIK